MMKVAIDLTWVRHQKVGGTESCVRNLLKGISSINPDNIKIFLILAKDNAESFRMYGAACFEHLVCDVNSSSQKERVIWQNTKLGKILRENNIKVLLEPIYSIPFWGMKGIRVLATIHDLQAIHYPEYFSKARVAWMKINWRHTVKVADKVIAISEYVKKDIVKCLKANADKVVMIYDAIDLNVEECNETVELKKYGIEVGKYYYTVSSLLPHKNLKSIVFAMAEIKKRNAEKMIPLVISGVGGASKSEILELAKKNNVEGDIILTPFIDNEERNMLYKNCKVFLFPSIFEGFGMPPIEAMAMGVPVLTTKYTSLEEVTGGLLNYVDNPLDPKEWADKLGDNLSIPEKKDTLKLLETYSTKRIAENYLQLFNEVFGKC